MIDQPLLSTITVNYHQTTLLSRFPSEKAYDKFYNDTNNHNGKKNYNLFLKDSGHLSYIDPALMQSKMLSLIGLIGSASTAGTKMEEIINFTLAFMNENEFLPVKFEKSVEECHDK